MAQIVISEISQNYTYNIGTNSYATVAMPITASWGPGYEDHFAEKYKPSEASESGGRLHDDDDDLENVVWTRFPSTSNGLQAFVQSYRGATSISRLAKDYSYQMAMTLMTAGYDVLVCRVANGTRANGKLSPIIYKRETIGEKEVIVYKTETREVEQYDPETGEKTGEVSQVDCYINKDGGIIYKVYKKGEGPVDVDLNNKFPITKDDIYTADGEYAENASRYLTSLVPDEEEVSEDDKIGVNAKYLGSFGNNIKVRLARPNHGKYMNLIVYTLDQYGVSTAVENFVFTFDFEKSNDTIPYVKEIESQFIKILDPIPTDDSFMELGTSQVVILENGSDYPVFESADDMKSYIMDIANLRFEAAKSMISTGDIGASYDVYMEHLETELDDGKLNAQAVALREFSYYAAMRVYTLLSDKLTYNPNRIISPGWDDQDFVYLFGGDVEHAYDIVDDINENDYDLSISPMHMSLMNAAYLSRCATSYIDIPRSLMRSMVYSHPNHPYPHENGYAQKLGNFVPTIVDADGIAIELDSSLYPTHSALFAPWGQYTMVGMSKVVSASPSFLALMIQRAQILNQAAQYEWALPTNRKHNLRIGKLDYVVPKKLMDIWQSLEGVGVNIITAIPDLGVNLWGNSTLYDVPPATYQALANLSTRLLVNAVEDVAYRVGISITFQYNNNDAYSTFYAGVTPILDTMRNLGAIDDYYVKMAADINGLDQVNANTVIGKIYLVINGVINDIYIDLIALPPGTDLNQYRD